MRHSDRLSLLPNWIIIFTWIFLILAFLACISIFAALIQIIFPIEIFGIKSNQPFSISWLIIIAIFLSKGVVSFLLLTQKKHAIDVAIFDALISIAICLLQLINKELRLELLLLIPYLRSLFKLSDPWKSENFSPDSILDSNH